MIDLKAFHARLFGITVTLSISYKKHKAITHEGANFFVPASKILEKYSPTAQNIHPTRVPTA